MPRVEPGFIGPGRNPVAVTTSKRVSPRSTHLLRPAPEDGAGSRSGFHSGFCSGPMKVLTFGWELAPILSGGLGVACAGLGRALVEEGIELTFVLPRLPRPISPKGIRVLDARDSVAAVDALPAVVLSTTGLAGLRRETLDGFETFSFETPLGPYQGAAAYREARRVAGSADSVPAEESIASGGVSPASVSRETADSSASLYAGDLIAEVARMAAAAATIAADVPHDIIHCHDWMTFAAGIAAREVSGKPLVLHVHSTEGDRSGGGFGNADIRKLEEGGLAVADLIVAVSDFTRVKILEQYPAVDAGKLRVVHNGTEPARHDENAFALPAFAEGRPIVLFLGRLTAQKGPEWFLKAAEVVHRLRPETLFVVAGNGEMLPWMVEKAAEMGLAASMLFTGFLSGDDIARAYAMADVFVMPSVSEPFGLVPIEAMMRGTPAIVSRQSGVSEVIRHCLKVDFWDTADLADKIVGVIDHPSLAASLAAAGQYEALGLGWAGPARRLLDVFAEVTETHSKCGEYP